MLGAATTFGCLVEHVGIPIAVIGAVAIVIEIGTRCRRARSERRFRASFVEPAARRSARRRAF